VLTSFARNFAEEVSWHAHFKQDDYLADISCVSLMPNAAIVFISDYMNETFQLNVETIPDN
jgi:hypothetical protein